MPSVWIRMIEAGCLKDIWPKSLLKNRVHCGTGGLMLHRLELHVAPKMESLQVLWALFSVFEFHHLTVIIFFPVTSNSNSVCCNSELWVSPNHYALQRQIWLHLLCKADIQETSKGFYMFKYLVCKNFSNDWIIFIKPVIAFGQPSSRAWIVSEIYKTIQ